MSDRLPVLDTIRQANLHSISKYECWTCGEVKPMTWENEHMQFDEGEHYVALICDECEAKGRHKLLR